LAVGIAEGGASAATFAVGAAAADIEAFDEGAENPFGVGVAIDALELGAGKGASVEVVAGAGVGSAIVALDVGAGKGASVAATAGAGGGAAA